MRDAPAAPTVRDPSRVVTQRPAWPWAIASILVVALVLGGILAAHAVVVAKTPPTVFAPPALPPLDAIAVAHPEAGAALVALDAGNGHLIALAAPRELTCPPVGACPAAPSPDAFVVLDGRSGQVLSSTPLGDDPATGARSLLADPATHRVYAVAPQAVTIFSTDSGARLGGFGLSSGFGDGAFGAALDPSHGILALASGSQALLVRTDSGQVAAQATLAAGNGGSLLDGPIVDSARGRLYLLRGAPNAASQPQLLALDAHSLRALGQYALPAGARLGPMDAAGANLFVFGADGTTWQLPLDVLASLPGGQPTLTAVPALRNALALGENPALAHHYVADADETRALGASGPLAALPLAARTAPSLPLLVDPARGLLYLSAAHGAIVIVQDTAGAPAAHALAPTAAVLLAQSALAATSPDSRDPPFLTADMFPFQAATRAQDFWTFYHGWQGPEAGQVSTQVTQTGGGGYQVTFTVVWQQLFPHQHVWDWAVAPDGGVRLVGNSGDVLP